jgi:hypothetical protein
MGCFADGGGSIIENKYPLMAHAFHRANCVRTRAPFGRSNHAQLAGFRIGIQAAHSK